MHQKHSSLIKTPRQLIKTPRQLIIVVLLAFLVPITLIALVAQLITGVKPRGSAEAEQGVLGRIKPVGEVTLAEATTPKGNKSGEEVYQTVCKVCHEAGLAGAPKIGDKNAWAPRIKTGVNVLYTSALQGKNAMPPRGGTPDLTDTEVQRAVVYMANKSGASFKEPSAPSAPATTAAAAPAAAPPSTKAIAPVTAPAPPSAATPVAAAKPGAPLDLKAGEALMQKDGCAACHAVDKKVVGPAYQEVAAKYKGDKEAATKLAQKVKAGGSGAWGTVPMPPNAQVPDDDIKALVNWILALKK